MASREAPKEDSDLRSVLANVNVPDGIDACMERHLNLAQAAACPDEGLRDYLKCCLGTMVEDAGHQLGPQRMSKPNQQISPELMRLLTFFWNASMWHAEDLRNGRPDRTEKTRAAMVIRSDSNLVKQALPLNLQ